MRINKIITTVGTSLLNNFQEVDGSFNTRISMIKTGRYEQNVEMIDSLSKTIASTMQNNTSACAEIQCHEAICRMNENRAIDEVILISSDTGEGVLCAKALQGIFEAKGINVSFGCDHIVKGLQMKDAKTFQREGLRNLFDVLIGLCPEASFGTVFNFAGGFKSVIPYLTIYVQIINRQMYYIYEESNELIEISGIPIIYDYAFFARNQDLIDKLVIGMPSNEWAVAENSHMLSFYDSFRSCIYDDGETATLNGLGYFLYDRYLSSYHLQIHKKCTLFDLERHEWGKQIPLVADRICGYIEKELAKGKSFNDIPVSENVHAKKARLDKEWYYGRINGKDNLQLRIAYSFIPLEKSFAIRIADGMEKRSGEDAVAALKKQLKSLDLSEQNFVDIYIQK